MVRLLNHLVWLSFSPQLTSAYISARDPPVDSGLDAVQLRPRVASGDTQQAILTAEYVAAQKRRQTLSELYTAHRLKDTL